MRQIEANKSEILAKLLFNRSKHIEDFKDAMRIFREEAANELRQRAKEFDGGVTTNLKIDLDVPVSHEKEYDIVIAMLESETRDKITITTAEFQSYVMDDWDWKEDFFANVSSYKARR